MPEGPEIRLAADEVAAAVVDRPTTAVFFAFEHLKKYEKQLSGAVVTAVDTYGKAMVTHFNNGYAIYSHNQLYGVWHVRSAHDYPQTNRQLRLAIHNEQQSALLYSASDIEVLHEGEVDAHPFISQLGPDLLHEAVTAVDITTRFGANEFKRRRLTTLLLDQHFLAGIGNYLRSEILFVAGVHPTLRPVDCSPEQIEKLATTTVALTRQSYQTRGITNDLERVALLKEQGHSRVDLRFHVFNRQGQPCYTCGTPIIKETMGGRRLYYCPTCQTK